MSSESFSPTDEQIKSIFKRSIQNGNPSIFEIIKKHYPDSSEQEDFYLSLSYLYKTRTGKNLPEDINEHGEEVLSPLMCAIDVGDLELIERLLKERADPNLISNYTAPIFRVKTVAAFKLLTQYDTNLTPRLPGFYQKNILYEFIMSKNQALVETVLNTFKSKLTSDDFKRFINQRVSQVMRARYALVTATKLTKDDPKCIPTVKLLLEFGANPLQQDDDDDKYRSLSQIVKQENYPQEVKDLFSQAREALIYTAIRDHNLEALKELAKEDIVDIMCLNYRYFTEASNNCQFYSQDPNILKINFYEIFYEMHQLALRSNLGKQSTVYNDHQVKAEKFYLKQLQQLINKAKLNFDSANPEEEQTKLYNEAIIFLKRLPILKDKITEDVVKSLIEKEFSKIEELAPAEATM